MSQDEANAINIRLSGIERNLDALMVAIQGNPKLGIDGMLQHVHEITTDLDCLKADVKSLKDDRRTVKGWIAGLSAAGGLGGVIGHWFSK